LIPSTTMATNQRNVPEFKLVLVGDGGVGMLNNSF
jgi:GTPase SAR1 family protein